jgi:hypothetical protein
MTHSQPVKSQIANGVWMSLAGAGVELFIPQWFGDAPIVLRTDRIVVCKIEEMRKEELRASARPLDVAFLERMPLYLPLLRKTVEPANLLIALAEPAILPPVRWRARLDPLGFLMHRHARARPPDGFGFHCVDRERVIADLTRHGAEQTNVPYAWVTTRRA